MTQRDAQRAQKRNRNREDVSGTAAVRSLLTLYFPGNPLPAPRPRLSNGHVHHRPEYAAQLEAWQTLARLRMLELDAEPFPPETRLGVRVVFYRADRRRCDLDNLLKSVFDALTGAVWKDDSQVDEVSARVVRGSKMATACTQIEVFMLEGGTP